MYVPGRQIGGAALTGLAQPTMQQLWGNLVGTMQRTTTTPPYARPTSALALNPQIQIHAFICMCMCIDTPKTYNLTTAIMNSQNPMIENIIFLAAWKVRTGNAETEGEKLLLYSWPRNMRELS